MPHFVPVDALREEYEEAEFLLREEVEESLGHQLVKKTSGICKPHVEATGLPPRDQPPARILSLGGAPTRDHSDLGASLSPPPPGWHSPSETGRVCVARRALPCLFRPFPVVSIIGGGEMRRQPPGKAVPAFGLLVVGLLMTWNTLTRWHRSRLDHAGPRFRNSLRFSPGKFPWDYVFIAVISLIGLISEAAYHRGMGMMWIEHAGSYLGPLLLAFVMIVKECRLASVPPNSDYAAAILGGSLQYILAAFTGSASPLEERSFAALKYVILANIAAVSTELLKSSHVTAGLFRCYSVILQGTWYLQLAVMYPPGKTDWDFHSMENVMFVTVSFALQVVFDAVLVLVLNVLVGKYVACRKRGCRNGVSQEEAKNLIDGGEP
ncbi:unnamed protein product [Darwinula stevensoni]|uniref:Uncharacterized protein n=1 Tax=Darwinula stevensoni TaxID=69355 RepID=A0A7R8XKP4_9CRUS|nr:unnamed protein product [Darwinula stevensoni]CAG0893360.1 unnamed protein product [Darwinula stevensoni]